MKTAAALTYRLRTEIHMTEKITDVQPVPLPEEFGRAYERIFRECGLQRYVTPYYTERFYALARYMATEGRKLNITSINRTEDVICRHFADSVAFADVFRHGASVIDVGTGGGFPSLPIAIVRGDLHITALDSTAKKIRYVANAAEYLGLDGINAISGRAEVLAATSAPESLRENFDYAVSRAVAAMPVLCELCLPFVRCGGFFVALKGPGGDDEMRMAVSAVDTLGGKFSEKREVLLRCGDEILKHYAFILQKNAATPIKYPRNFSRINKKPL